MYYIQFYDHPGPVLLGYPMHRPRTYASLIFKVGFVWHGSSEHYKETFVRSLEVNGSAYYVANEGELQEELQLLLQRRGRTVPSGASASDVDWGEFSSVGVQSRVQEHTEEVRWQREDSDGTYIADLEHHISHGPKAGACVPTLVRHGLLHNFKLRRPLLPEEHLAAQGHPIVGLAKEASFKSFVQPVLDCCLLSRTHLKALAGNAMHGPTVGSIIFYTLAMSEHVVPRERMGAHSRTTKTDMQADGSQMLFF